MAFPKAALGTFLSPLGDKATQIASERCERFVPANGVLILTLGNQAIDAFTMVWKNGTLLDDGAATPAYTLKGKTITLHTAANGSDVFIVRYHFRTSN